MIYIDNLDFPRAKELELIEDGDENKVPGYLVECTDGHTYLIFAPDKPSAEHMYNYRKLLEMRKHKSLRLAFSKYRDEYHDHKIFHAPASEIGKIYVVE